MAWTGISEAISALKAMEHRVDQATKITVIQVAADVERSAKANFIGSHAPNESHVPNGPPERPNIVTGRLRASIRSSPVLPMMGGYSSSVGPTVLYGRRVELGYKGTDSLGRRYNQQPFMYFRPAAKDVAARANNIALANWTAATR